MYNDYDHRYPEAGKMIDTIRAIGTGFQRIRENYRGPVFAEGRGADYYWAGLNDGDYGKLPGFGHRLKPRQVRYPLLVDFRLNHVGFVFQSFNLFSMHTALDNVAMPLMYKGVNRQVRTARARKMLTAVGLGTHMKHKPTQMSGGQQQRVGIARALVTQPKILFADEPTGNLDFNTSREILRLIRDICHEKNTTLIMVTHDPEMAQYADRVIRLLDGRVIENTVNEHPEEIPMIVRESEDAETDREQDEE